MNGGALTLVVSGPVPGSERGDAESASALARELHTRTILHVARPGADDSPAPFDDGGLLIDDGGLLRPAGPGLPGPSRSGAPDPAGSGTPDPAGSDASGPAGNIPPGLLGRKGGGAGTMAELVVTGLFSATTVAALAQVAVAFVERGAARRIVLRDGRRSLTISAPSEETEQMVVEWLGVPPTQSGAGSGAD
ncbi:hypothetical protein ACN28C_32105 [Plantactinospora sp. WMMC1484]|uniref:hypothetical protein n=1 Tax=Plantactinospora sp. WMMC1484 TaxID=3404122 RepID=UPI003BF5E2B9